MDLLYNLGINDLELKGILELVPEILDMSEIEISNKIDILKYIECNDRHIKNILVSNPYYLDRFDNDILKLIGYLKNIGVSNLNLLFDSNPYLLNRDDFEIRDYIENRVKNGDSLDNIICDIEDNPYIIDID